MKALNRAHVVEQQQLQVKLAAHETENKRLKEQVAELQRGLNKTVIAQHKSLQVNLDVDDRQFKMEDEIKNYYENLNYFVIGGRLRNLDWATFLMTDIFNNKFRADYDDFKAGRSFSTLREFVLQYFLKKFECRRGGLTLLRDFFFTLGQRLQENLRIETFLMLCEANTLRSKLSTDINEFLNKNKLALKIYGLPSTCALYIELAFSLKNLRSNDSVYFMPNDDHNCSFLIRKSEAADFATKMFDKLRIEEAAVGQAMAKFDRVVKTDLAVRVVNNKVTAHDENEKNRYISFDALIE